MSGTGLLVRSRVAFFSFIFLLASDGLGAPATADAAAARDPGRVSLFAVAFMVTRAPVVARWNGRLAGVTEVGQHVRPNSTVLQLDWRGGRASTRRSTRSG